MKKRLLVLRCLFLWAACPAAQAAELPNYQSSFLANTFSGQAEKVLSRISAAAVSPDGKVYCNVNWDEEHKEASIYQDGHYVGQLNTYGVHPTGDAIAVAGNYAFAASGQELHRYNRHDGLGYVKLADLGENPVALAASTTQVAVTLRSGWVKLFQTNGTFIRQFAVTQPGSIAIASNGDIYVARNLFRQNEPDNPWWDCNTANPATIVRYANDGTLLSGSVSASSSWLPVHLHFDKNGLLYVADNGPDQNIKKYNVPAFTSAGTFGVVGGYLAGPIPGQTGPQRLMRPMAVGTDTNLNLYVVGSVPNVGYKDRGRVSIRKFDTSGNLLWELLGLAFVDAACPSAESDALDIYSVSNRFRMDYSKPIGQQWTHAAVTVNPFQYRVDTRPGSARIITLSGQKFMFSVGQYASPAMIHRFVGEIAVPSVRYNRQRVTMTGQPTANRKLFWRDSSGNGQSDSSDAWSLVDGDDGEFFGTWIDDAGNIWDAYWNGSQSRWKVRRFNYGGLDAVGNPIYSWSNVTEWNLPSPLNEPCHIHYDSATDTMYLSGFSAAYPKVNDQGTSDPVPWGTGGSVIYRYDNWTTTRTIHAGYPIVSNWFVKTFVNGSGTREVDFEGTTVLVGFSVAGNAGSTTSNDGYVFAHLGPKGRETARHGEVNVWRASDAGYEGFMQPINMSPANAQVGWVDTRLGIQAQRRSNGDYIVVMEEDYLQKFLLWKWTPANILKYEAETLAIAAQSTDTHRIIDAPQFSNGQGTILDSDAISDFVSYTVPNVAAGNYRVKVGVKKFTSRGFVQLAIGRADNFAGTATNVGSPMDLFAPGEEWTEIDLGMWSPISTSDKQFRFTVTGKNAASSNYTLSIDYIKLESSTSYVPVGFGAYQASNYTAAQLANPAISGPQADANRDGLANVMAYAIGISPWASPPASSLPTVSVVNGYLQLSYVRLIQPIAIGYSVEVTSDLVGWNAGPAFTTELSAVNLDATRQLVTVRDNTPAATLPRRAMRLRVDY
jgi:hypothetical protein